MHRKTMFLLAVILFMIVCVVAGQFTPSGSKDGKDPRFVFAEKYRPQQSDYKYGFVDTNPARRVGAFSTTAPLKIWEIASAMILTKDFLNLK